MEAIFVFALIGIPCLIGLIWSFTPHGKKWRRVNGML